MNVYDQMRKDRLIKSLMAAKKQGETTALYLGAKDQPVMEDIYAVEDALEHITIALERLGVEDGSLC